MLNRISVQSIMKAFLASSCAARIIAFRGLVDAVASLSADFGFLARCKAETNPETSICQYETI